ncbi:MAG: hypothetical protein WC745_03895 [Patescibacteria group bacterium]|jgi:hypothetical protein
MLKSLTCNKSIPLSSLNEKTGRLLKGIASLTDDKGAVKGFFIDLNSWEELLEDMESAAPEFSEEMSRSKASGRISGANIKKTFGIK